MADSRYTASHKIGWLGASILIIISILADIIDYIEGTVIPATDAVMWVVDAILIFKGLSGANALVVMLLQNIAELFPIVGALPFFTLGSVVLLFIDRSETASRVAATVSAQKIKKQGAQALKKTSQSSAALTKRAQKTRRSLARIQRNERKIADLQKKLPGPLRSLPKSWGYDPDTTVSGQRGSTQEKASRAWSTAKQKQVRDTESRLEREDGDFLNTFKNIEEENFPQETLLDTPPQPQK